MKRTSFKYFLFTTVVLVFGACSVTRHIPDGKYMLVRNVVEEDRNTARKDRIREDQVQRFIQPETNRRLFGTNFFVQLYNMADPDTSNHSWRSRTMRRLGEPPVLLDSLAARQSADFIHNYAVYSGFYNSRVSFRVDTMRNKKVKVAYSIEQGTPYRIGNVTYEFRDEFLRPIVMSDSAATLLHIGDILDGNVLSTEKTRITARLKDNGYYNFTLNNIDFIGDSTAGNQTVDLTVVFRQSLSGYTQRGEPIYENNSIYRLGTVTVNPDFNPVKIAADPEYYANMDTVAYRGLNIIYPQGEKTKVREKILRRAINLYPNYLYRASDTQQAYTNIMRLGYYKSANITFDTMPAADSVGKQEVSYVGEDEQVSGETTTEQYMACHINCVPALLHSYKIELEGATTSNYNSVTATFGYQNRNLFRGVELFDISLKGGYEFFRGNMKGNKASFELGATASLSFPRFIFPFDPDPFSRRVNPRTKAEISINTQRRPYYHRTLSSVNWGYSWSNRHRGSFTLRPIDINLIQLSYRDEEFFENIQNEYLKNSYEPQLVAGISGSFVYNAQAGLTNTPSGQSLLFRLNWETAGNLINLISNIAGTRYKDGDEEYYRIFGIRYGQYFRIDGSISNRFIMGPKTSIAYRFYAGGGTSYGNAAAMPFDRLLYAGGSNSMRGWLPRTLGPGNAVVSSTDYPIQLGNLKLEANAEFRFPVWGILNGAVFFDIGNIWYTDSDMGTMGTGGVLSDDGVFRFDRFYRQLGFNTGLGFRFDIGMAILRFDWGMKIHDPNRLKGDRWIRKFHFDNTVLNFGVGYPF